MIIENLSFEEYRANPALNWSSAKNYAMSPAHFLNAKENPLEQTPAMLVGSALHSLVLEGPVAFSHRYVRAPECDRRTKIGKELWSQFVTENAGREVLTSEQFAIVSNMHQSLAVHPVVTNLLRLCHHRESSVFWEDSETGIPCKCRLDGFSQEHGIAFDLKTSDDASSSGFARTCAKFGYHGQAAFYLDGLQAAGVPASQFVFIVIEKAPPYGIACFLADEDMLRTGRLRYQEYLHRHAECLAADNWPGYPEEIQPLSLPAWA